MRSIKRRLDKAESLLGPKSPVDVVQIEKPMLLFQVLFLDGMEVYELLDDYGVPDGPRFSPLLGLQYMERYIAEQGAEAVVVYDPEHCTETMDGFHPKHPPRTPERYAEVEAWRQRIAPRAESEMFLWNEVRPGQFLEMYRAGQGVNP